MDQVSRRPLRRGQLEYHLEVQLAHLRTSAAAVDGGNPYEYVRLANTLRVLLHHRGQSKALLVQLGLRDQTLWVDTCRYRADVNLQLQALLTLYGGQLEPGLFVATEDPGQTGLVTLALDDPAGAPRWAAPLGEAPVRLTPFEAWWTAPGIETSSGHTFSRRDLVLLMTNQDGGSHVDPDIDVTYDDFRSDFLGFQFADAPDDITEVHPPGGWRIPEGNVANSSIRQVAWEVEDTIRRLGLPWLPDW